MREQAARYPDRRAAVTFFESATELTACLHVHAQALCAHKMRRLVLRKRSRGALAEDATLRTSHCSITDDAHEQTFKHVFE